MRTHLSLQQRIFGFICLLLWFGCEALSFNLSPNAGKNTTAEAVDSLLHKPSLPDTLVFLDTVVEKLGRIRVYLNDSVLVFQDELIGDQVVLKDSSYFSKRRLPTQPPSGANWYVFDNERWFKSNLTFTDSGLLFLSVDDEEGSLHFFALRLVDGRWYRLCESNTFCYFHSVVGICTVLYPKQDRFFIMEGGWGIDEKDDAPPIYYKGLSIYQFNKTDMTTLGSIRFAMNLGECHCNTEDNERWFRSYLKVANQNKYDGFYMDF